MIAGWLSIRGVLLGAALALAVLLLPVEWSAPIVAITVLTTVARTDRAPAQTTEVATAQAQTAVADLAELIAPLAEGVLLLDAERSVVASNPAAARIVGRSFSSMVGVSLVVATRDHDLAEVVRAATGLPVQVHVSAAAHDVVATATRVDAGRVQTLLVMEDVTELEQARRARAELVSNLSHELRTPIAAARALTETLQAGVDDEEDRIRFLGHLAEEVGRLGEMVERLLRLSRLESGGETFALTSLDLSELLQTAAERIRPLARPQGVTIEVMHVSVSTILGDRDRVLEVLSNLLDNALRYSPTGARIQLAAMPDDEEPAMVRVEVDDDGPGILPSDRDRIFERFYTGDRARGAGGGTGLGLSIARHIVQRLGGRIWVADRSPGATICFTLPVVGGQELV